MSKIYLVEWRCFGDRKQLAFYDNIDAALDHYDDPSMDEAPSPKRPFIDIREIGVRCRKQLDPPINRVLPIAEARRLAAEGLEPEVPG